MNIQLPYLYEPRDYQIPILRAIDSGKKRIIAVWHRRAGKEKTCVAGIVSRKMLERVGSYYYCFPEFNQGRKVLWDGMDRNGMRFLDHFPKKLLSGEPNNTEMKLRYKNGSIFQVIGSDRYNSLMGPNPVGMVFSEYSLQNPYCWGFFRPILAENQGWSVFNFTPRGENHAYDLFKLGKANPQEWYTEVLTVDDTKAISPEVLAQERREMITLYGNDSLFRQEYYCDFSVPISGAYYADQISLAYQEGRITQVPWDDTRLVDTWWDLGMDDDTAIWFTQTVGATYHVIDYYKNSGQGLPHYVEMLKRKPYVYQQHVVPHDINVREWAVGKTRLQIAHDLGLNVLVCPRIEVIDGINAGRSLFRKCWFDQEKCKDGINSLKNYTKLYDDKAKNYKDHPYHNWASHGADAFRTFAVGVDYESHSMHPTASPEEILRKKSRGGQGWVHPRYRTIGDDWKNEMEKKEAPFK